MQVYTCMKFQGTQIVSTLPIFKSNLSEYENELSLAIEAAHLLKENVPAMESNVKSQYVSPYNSHKLEPKLKPLCDLAVKSCNFVAGSISPFLLNSMLTIVGWHFMNPMILLTHTTIGPLHYPA